MAEKRDGRSEADRCYWAIRWEQVRLAHFSRLNRRAEAQQCRELVEKWQKRQADLFDQAQRT